MRWIRFGGKSARSRLRSKRRIIPRLEVLEDRTAPAVVLNVGGANVDTNKLNDTQAEGTIAVDPNSSKNQFTASVNSYGSTQGTYSATYGIMPGLAASYSTNSGAGWTGSDGGTGYLATGGPGGDSLPAAAADPRASWDQFGNLFLTYIAGSTLQLGRPTDLSGKTMTDNGRSWSTDEWKNQTLSITTGTQNQQMTIVSNTATTISVAKDWTVPFNATTTSYQILGSGPSVVLADSVDGGKTFQYDTMLDTGKYVDQPSVATGPGQSGQGSVWVAWRRATGDIRAAGASVTGQGLPKIGTFTTEAVKGPANINHASIAIGPTGQVVVSMYGSGDATNPKPITIYTNTDADGLGPNVFAGTPTAAVSTVKLEDLTTETGATIIVTIPAQPERGIVSNASLAWDRSGIIKGKPNGRLYMVYASSVSKINDPNTDIYLIYSDDAGSTWSPPIRVNSGNTKSQFNPAIAVDQKTGYVAVTWYDAQNDPANRQTQLFGTVSTDGGKTFQKEVKIAAKQSDATKAGSWFVGSTNAVYTNTTLTDKSKNWITNYWKGNYWVRSRSCA